MSYQPCPEPAVSSTESLISTAIRPRPKDIGGFEVRRALPSRACRSVGPFVFFDEVGPADLSASQGIDVRPHPHIGIATVTYLFEGAFLHRDSLGTKQEIRPGAVNWMTAGRGIVHCERTPEDLRKQSSSFHGIQTWVALPRDQEDCEPAFEHCPVDTLPTCSLEGVELRIIAGSAYGRRSPVHAPSGLFYVLALMNAGSQLRILDEYPERAVYPVDASLDVGGHELEPHSLGVLESSRSVTIVARDTTRVLLLGGTPLDGPRHMEWNFVSSQPEKIAQAKHLWQAGGFGSIAHDPERVALPDHS